MSILQTKGTESGSLKVSHRPTTNVMAGTKLMQSKASQAPVVDLKYIVNNRPDIKIVSKWLEENVKGVERELDDEVLTFTHQ